ncbi:unnamed protein product, partial [Ectocarpus sp. 13 AM-2016]
SCDCDDIHRKTRAGRQTAHAKRTKHNLRRTSEKPVRTKLCVRRCGKDGTRHSKDATAGCQPKQAERILTPSIIPTRTPVSIFLLQYWWDVPRITYGIRGFGRRITALDFSGNVLRLQQHTGSRSWKLIQEHFTKVKSDHRSVP